MWCNEQTFDQLRDRTGALHAWRIEMTPTRAARSLRTSRLAYQNRIENHYRILLEATPDALTVVDEDKRAEANLLQMDELNRAQATLNGIGDAVVCTDLMTNITFLNLAAATMTGWSMDEAWGHPLADILNTGASTGNDSSTNTAELAILENCAELVPTRCVLVRRDGMKIPIENSVAPLHDQNGHASGAVVVFRDTSAAHAVAQQITHAADRPSGQSQSQNR
jgi:PAS domain S-box-containing protein